MHFISLPATGLLFGRKIDSLADNSADEEVPAATKLGETVMAPRPSILQRKGLQRKEAV